LIIIKEDTAIEGSKKFLNESLPDYENKISSMGLDVTFAMLLRSGNPLKELIKHPKIKGPTSELLRQTEISKLKEKKAFRSAIVDYLQSISGEVGKKTELTQEQQVNSLLVGVFSQYPQIKYNGKSITVDNLNDQFDPKKVTINPMEKQSSRSNKMIKTVSVNRFKTSTDDVIDKTKTPKLYSRLVKLRQRMQRLYSEYDGTYTPLEFVVEDFKMLQVFRTKNLMDFNKRDKAYSHWEKIHDMIETAIDKIRTDLVPKLEEVDKDKGYRGGKGDIEKFIDFIKRSGEGTNNLEKINYIVKLEPRLINVPYMDKRSIELLEMFLMQNNLIEENIDKGKFTQFDAKEGIGEKGHYRSADIDIDQVSDYLPDEETDKEIEELITSGAKKSYKLDALGILNFERNQKKSASAFKGTTEETGELEETIEQLKELLTEDFNEYKEEYKDDDLKIYIDEDIEEKFKEFKKNITEMESTDGLSYLPIYALKQPELKNYYKNDEVFDSLVNVQESVDEFLLLYKNLVEGNQKSQTPKKISTGQLTGVGTVQGELPSPSELFSYATFLSGKKGTPREFSKTSKEKNKKLMEVISEVNEILYICFSKQIFSQYLYGIDLPFEKDAALKTITANLNKTNINLKEDPLYILTNVFNENPEAFIEDAQIESMNQFLSKVGIESSLSNYENIKDSAELFLNAVKDIYDAPNKSKFNVMLKKEVASLLGSIYQYAKDKDDISSNFKGINIESAYRELFIDDIKDISSLDVLGNFILNNKDAIVDEDNKAELEELMGHLDRVTKSEIHKKILQAHDSLRILKSKPVMFAMKNENSFDDVNSMITKMENDYSIDMSATEIISIVSKLDSFEGIAKEHGITSEHVYVIKAHFR